MSNETIFREVDEELRSDRMRALWRRFGPWVIGAAVAVVLVVAANEGWSWWQNANAARSSDQFYTALTAAQGDDPAAADAALDAVIAEGSGGYPTLARFRQASLLANDGKTAEAVAAYDAIAATDGNRRLRELALVLGSYLLVDAGDVAGVEQRLGTLTGADNPLRNAAREAIGLARYKAGDVGGARESFEAIVNDQAAEPNLQRRVRLYIAQIISEGALDDAAATSAAPAVDAASEVDTAPAVAVEAAPAGEPAAPATEDAPAEPQGN